MSCTCTGLVRWAFVLVLIAVFAPVAWAWGPHSEITVAAAKALDKDDPFLAFVQNDMGTLRVIAWANDNAAAGAIVNFRGYRIYAQDFFASPNFMPVWGSDTGHGYDPTDDSYKGFYLRTLQAMQTESRDNAIGWLGALVHLTEDTGAPPHAGHVPWEVHIRMESWLAPAKIDITGYKPLLLGTTPDEALKAFYKRIGELHEFSATRGKALIPVVRADNRAKSEPVIFECALESARVTADMFRTMGYLWSQIKPVPGSGSLAGTIAPAQSDDLVTAKLMLLGTNYSTLADPKGHYEFRNLPPGDYRLAVMLPTCRAAIVETRIEADKATAKDVSLDRTGNVLRNGDQLVSFLEKAQPDGWFKVVDPQPLQPQWLGEWFTAMRGQAFKLTVKWKAGAAGEAAVLYHWKGWDAAKTLKAPAESMVFEAPAEMDGRDYANVWVHADGKPWDVIESLTVTPEGKPAAASHK